MDPRSEAIDLILKLDDDIALHQVLDLLRRVSRHDANIYPVGCEVCSARCKICVLLLLPLAQGGTVCWFHKPGSEEDFCVVCYQGPHHGAGSLTVVSRPDDLGREPCKCMDAP
eukprot:3677902-Karenia_brevis.AAC.1